MRAIVLNGSHIAFDANRPAPHAAPGEVEVRVLYAGICETDLQLLRGYMGFQGVPGHEFVGIAQGGRFAGKRVVGEINCSCWQCATCQAGAANHCPERTVLGILKRDGAFAETLVLPERNLHRVPDSVPDWAAVFTEPLAAAFRIAEQVPATARGQTVVLGDGRLGNLCAQVLRKQGCEVTVIGKHERKLQILRELGFEAQLLGQAANPERCDLVIDCTGSATGLETALSLVRPRGTVVLKTTVAAEHRLSLAPVVIDELTIVGSRCGPFEPALEALARGEICLEPLIDATVPLEQAPQALAQASTAPALKILIDIDGAQRHTTAG